MLFVKRLEQINEDDNIILHFDRKDIKAVVIEAGTGTSNDDSLYWLHAPSKGIAYSSEPPEVKTSYLLAKAYFSKIPFDRIPHKVKVQRENGSECHEFLITALVGFGNPDEGCLVYLEYLEGEK